MQYGVAVRWHEWARNFLAVEELPGSSILYTGSLQYTTSVSDSTIW